MTKKEKIIEILQERGIFLEDQREELANDILKALNNPEEQQIEEIDLSSIEIEPYNNACKINEIVKRLNNLN